MKTVNDCRFYVYAYLRKDGTPYYIGKGTGRRAWRHNKTDRIQAPADHSQVLLLKDGLTSQEACDAEVLFIDQYGRKKDGGILVNWTAGGDGLADPDDKVRLKMSAWERTDKVCANIKKAKTKHLDAEAAMYGIPLEDYAALEKKTRYQLKQFVAKYPQISFLEALEMGGSGRSQYAARSDESKAKRQRSRKASGVEDKIAAANRERAPKYNWLHPEHGEVFCAAWQLVAMFPEQKLTRPNLSKVALGERKRCKGWELAV